MENLHTLTFKTNPVKLAVGYQVKSPTKMGFPLTSQEN